GRVEAGVLHATGSETFSGRSLARTAERARGAKADVIEQDDEHIGGARRRTQRADPRKLRIRILRIVGRQTDWFAVRNRQHFAWDVVLVHRSLPPALVAS